MRENLLFSIETYDPDDLIREKQHTFTYRYPLSLRSSNPLEETSRERLFFKFEGGGGGKPPRPSNIFFVFGGGGAPPKSHHAPQSESPISRIEPLMYMSCYEGKTTDILQLIHI